MDSRKKALLAIIAAVAVVTVILLLWKPTVLIFGVQRAGLYAAVALPMALILGIVHIVNLAHGEMMILSAYITYAVARALGVDPFLVMIPTAAVMFIVGAILYRVTIKHAIEAPELNQLILTFGLAMVISQGINMVATSQPRKLSLDYVTASLTIGDISFGVYDFIFVALAIIMLLGLTFFLKKTTMGKAALAVGVNPRGAAIVGINVHKTYMLVFAASAAMLGILGTFFLTKMSLFPTAGGAFTMKSFCLVAMAGIGNLPTILLAALALGVAEAFIGSFAGMGSWTHIVFFAMIIAVILGRSFRGKSL